MKHRWTFNLSKAFILHIKPVTISGSLPPEAEQGALLSPG